MFFILPNLFGETDQLAECTVKKKL
jgi:hypothetical protein